MVIHKIAIAAVCVACAAGAGCSTVGPDVAAGRCEIDVGPNVQVSDVASEGDIFAMEPTITVNPLDENNIVIAGFSYHDTPTHHWKGRRRTYFSVDGGRNWPRTDLPLFNAADQELALFRPFGLDPALIFDRTGRAVLSNNTDVFSSRDGGRSWSPLSGRYGDMDLVTYGADLSDGPYGGRIYQFALGHSQDYRDRNPDYGTNNSTTMPLRVMALDANGAVIHDVEIASHRSVSASSDRPDSEGVVNVFKGLEVPVDRDGVVYLFFSDGTRAEVEGARPTTRQFLSISENGGRSVSAPRELLREGGAPLAGDTHALDVAVDRSDGPYSDRLYIVWLEQRASNHWQVLLSSSDDQGRTWSGPLILEDHLENPNNVIASGSYQQGASLPLIQVNNRGHVLVTWYRFQAEPGSAEGHQTVSHRRVVTASLDGGATFLPVRALADVATPNYRPAQSNDGWGESSGPNGDLGHYMRMTVDRRGRFHTLWLDGRTGAQEIWYSNVNVECVRQ